MQFLSLPIAAFHAPDFVGEDPTNRATWITLLAYCAEMENGGRIRDCAEWGDRRWQQTCKVTAAEVKHASSLLRWDGADLIVAHYPSSKESEIQAKRKAGAERAAARWGSNQLQPPQADSSPDSSPDSSATCSATCSAHAYSKVRYSKVKEEKNPPTPSGGAFKEDPTQLPVQLRTARMQAAWIRWQNYRRARRGVKNWKSLFTEQSAWLGSFTESESVEILETSMRNGWTGLFPLKNASNRNVGRKGTDRNEGTFNESHVGDYGAAAIVVAAAAPVSDVQ